MAEIVKANICSHSFFGNNSNNYPVIFQCKIMCIFFTNYIVKIYILQHINTFSYSIASYIIFAV
jgi:hypothetical protein